MIGPISKILKKRYTEKLVRSSWRTKGKNSYTYYITLCLYFLDRPFGFIGFKRKAKKIIKTMEW